MIKKIEVFLKEIDKKLKEYGLEWLVYGTINEEDGGYEVDLGVESEHVVKLGYIRHIHSEQALLAMIQDFNDELDKILKELKKNG